MEDVFELLEKRLIEMGEDLQPEYEKAVIEEVNRSADFFHNYLLQNSGSETLNKYMYDKPIKTAVAYTREIDWDNNIIVNELDDKKETVTAGKGWGAQASRPREKGKRNYSIAPATVHDLAYIIENGEKNPDGTTQRLGTYFIKKGMRRVKQSLKTNIRKNYERRLLELEDKLLE